MPKSADRNREALVLLILDGLRRRKLTPIRQHELHQLVRHAQSSEEPAFRYLDKPISYSYPLQDCLTTLERSRCLSELISIRNGWVPRYKYRLDLLGQMRALEHRERLKVEDPGFLQQIETGLTGYEENYTSPVSVRPRKRFFREPGTT